MTHLPSSSGKNQGDEKLQKIWLSWSWQPVINAGRANEAIMMVMMRTMTTTVTMVMMTMVMMTMVLAASD